MPHRRRLENFPTRNQHPDGQDPAARSAVFMRLSRCRNCKYRYETVRHSFIYVMFALFCFLLGIWICSWKFLCRFRRWKWQTPRWMDPSIVCPWRMTWTRPLPGRLPCPGFTKCATSRETGWSGFSIWRPPWWSFVRTCKFSVSQGNFFPFFFRSENQIGRKNSLGKIFKFLIEDRSFWMKWWKSRGFSVGLKS